MQYRTSRDAGAGEMTRAGRRPRSPLHLECGRESPSGEEGASLLLPTAQGDLPDLHQHYHQHQQHPSRLPRLLCAVLTVGMTALLLFNVTTTSGRDASSSSSSSPRGFSSSSSAWLPPMEEIRTSANSCPPEGGVSIPLWPEDQTPGARGRIATDIPSLTPFLPPAGQWTGAAMLVLPGGGYKWLSVHEGKGMARWLCSGKAEGGLGVAAFVLQYRLASNGYHHPSQFEDVRRAVRLVRYLVPRLLSSTIAVEERPAPPVGIIGSSAGGHLAGSLLVHHQVLDHDMPPPVQEKQPASSRAYKDEVDRKSCRPDVGVLVYPVITMLAIDPESGRPLTHEGSRDGVVGLPAEKEAGQQATAKSLLEWYSLERQVTDKVPPLFVFHGADDAVVPVQNSRLLVKALQKHEVAHEYFEVPSFRHGKGMGDLNGTQPRHEWTIKARRWLSSHGL